ncbi:hypothetical protein NC652_041158 [Populus alba x Populus x berolinensis]|nr:hypothetical protein NC652_041158 [Populus alba x Populus x berolinensis]
MSRDKSRKRTYKSYSLLLGLQIMKSCIKALSPYNPQNLSSPKKLMVLLKSSSRKENLLLLHQESFPPDTTKSLMSLPKCRSVEVINNPARPGSNHREVNCINYK